MTSLDTLAAGKYLSLTTFRKDGTPVATPVWLVREGDALHVVTESDSGKAKRLRNSGRVVVAPCDMRGRLQGDSVEAVAILEDEAETARIAGLIRARYGFVGRVLMKRAARASKRAGHPTQVGITIRLA